MGFFKDMMEEDRRRVEAIRQADRIAESIAEKQKRNSTCKLCKKIFSEGYPYEYTMFGKPKNYICGDCASTRGLSSNGFGHRELKERKTLKEDDKTNNPIKMKCPQNFTVEVFWSCNNIGNRVCNYSGQASCKSCIKKGDYPK